MIRCTRQTSMGGFWFPEVVSIISFKIEFFFSDSMRVMSNLFIAFGIRGSIVFGLVCSSIWFLSSCSNEMQHAQFQEWTGETKKIRVLSTTAMLDDLVGQIGGERISHLSLMVGDVDPHCYELVKGDDEKFCLAQIVFYNGLGLEHGASVRYQLETHPCSLALGEEVARLFPEKIIYVNGEIDPHLWMDISLWSETIDPIVQALSNCDPEGKEIYERNGEQLKIQMHEAHQRVCKEMGGIPDHKRFLVTSHDAFNYFAKAYLATEEEKMGEGWRDRFDAPEGLSPDGQLGAADIQQVIRHLEKHQIKTVFPESNVSRDSLKKIVSVCAQKGWKVVISPEVLYGDAIGEMEGDEGAYLKMVEHNANVLIKAWEGEG